VIATSVVQGKEKKAGGATAVRKKQRTKPAEPAADVSLAAKVSEL
jgi:hypothetical protein